MLCFDLNLVFRQTRELCISCLFPVILIVDHAEGPLLVCVFSQGVTCDLVTGEERTFMDPEGRAAGHVSCTIEMCSVNTPCE